MGDEGNLACYCGESRFWQQKAETIALACRFRKGVLAIGLQIESRKVPVRLKST